MTRLSITALAFILSVAATAAQAPTGAATGTLAQRIGHYDTTKARHAVGVHIGAGSMEIVRVLGPDSLSTVFKFLDIGIVNPRSGLGLHFHDSTEEMFMSLEGPDAQFTIDSHTSTLKTPAGAPVRLGQSHAFYNPTDQPMMWLDWGVGNFSKLGGGFNLGDDRANATIEKIPQFIQFHIDPALLKPVEKMHGGTGTVMYRRHLDPEEFRTPWSYMDEVSIPPGANIGPVTEPAMSEIFLVLGGAGVVTVNGETAAIKKWDAIPVDVGQTHSFRQTGAEPLHMLATGIAKDMDAKRAYFMRPGMLTADGRP